MAKGDGTIVKKSRGVFEVQVSFGKSPVTGKYERVTRTVHGTMKDARRVRDEIRNQHDGGLSIDGQRVTFGDFAAQWLESKRLAGLARNTLKDYGAIVARATETFGDVKLCDVKAKTVEDYYNLLRKEGTGETRLNKIHTCFNQIFKLAVRYDLIMRNPIERVDAPKRTAPKRRSLSVAESARLKDAIEGDIAAETEKSLGYNPGKRAMSLFRVSRLWAVRLALATGMRRGELLGLTWEDIDLSRALVNVHHSLNRFGELKAPKTDAGIRGIYLDRETAERLASWKATQAEMLADICVEQTGKTPVCCSSTGTFMGTSKFSQWWAGYCKTIGFPGLRIHELRHTQATQLLAHGVDVKTVQHRLGHSNASLTLNWYAHALPENDRKAAELFGKMLDESDGTDNVVELPKSA